MTDYAYGIDIAYDLTDDPMDQAKMAQLRREDPNS